MRKSVVVAIIGGAAIIAASIIEIVPYLMERGDKNNGADSLKFPVALDSLFYPSGFVGDSEIGSTELDQVEVIIGHKNTVAYKISYHQGPNGWAGIYWQYPENNWGQLPGRDLTGAHLISFYAKGEYGGEIVEFKSGGVNDGQHPDNYDLSLGQQALSKNWRRYEITLSDVDLSNVVGAFAWSSPGKQKTDPIKIYIAKITIR